MTKKKIEITYDKMAANMKKFGIDGLKMTLDTYNIESAATAITHKGPLAITREEICVDGVNEWLHKKIEAESCNSSNIISIIDSDQLLKEYDYIAYETGSYGITMVVLKNINIETVEESEEPANKDIEIYVVDKQSGEVEKHENSIPVDEDFVTINGQFGSYATIRGKYIIICGK